MEEIFKAIPGFEDYEISNFGRVISYKRKEPVELTINSYSNGYNFVVLSKNGESKGYLLHRLVLKTFKPIDNDELYEVNHIDCNRNNNHLENLEWCAQAQNQQYRDSLLHTPKAETIEVEFLNGEKMIFNTMTECANYFNVSRKCINKYIDAKTIRSDRKIQAYFRRLGRTSDLNKNNIGTGINEKTT